jgi:hypothetical protein
MVNTAKAPQMKRRILNMGFIACDSHALDNNYKLVHVILNLIHLQQNSF